MARVIGLNPQLKRLNALRIDALGPAIGQALFVTAQTIQVDAQISLTTGAVSGAGHKPSSPGSPPHNDTGGLANGIEAVLISPFKAEVSSNAPYAAIQEYGGTINHPGGTPYFMRDGRPVFVSKQGQGAFHTLPVTKPHLIELPERPYMRPAAAKNRRTLAKNIALVMKAKGV